MKNKLLLILLTLGLFSSCDNNTTTKTKKTKNTVDINNKSDDIGYKNINNCKSLLIIAEDRSGSTKGERKMTADDYTEIIDAFIKHSSGQIVVRVIGNPSPAEQNFYTLRIRPQKEYKRIEKKDPLLSEKAAVRKKNKKIDEINEKIIAKNKEKAKKYIADKIIPHVINYKPYKKRDLTNIEDALNHIVTKINEPTFESYDNIQVLIISDGKHDSHKLKKKLTFAPERDIQLYLIGWKDKKLFEGLSEVNSFEGIDGFLEFFNDHECL